MDYFQTKPNYKTRTIAGDTILFRAENGVISNDSAIVFNESGSFLWKCLQEKNTKEDLAVKLITAYGIDTDTARADTEAFIEKCLKEDLISSYEEQE